MSRPTIHNVNLHSKNEEYRLQLASGFTKFSIGLREENDLRMAFRPGGTEDAYVLIRKGARHYEDNIPVVAPGYDAPLNVYLRCAEADHQTAEIIIWE